MSARTPITRHVSDVRKEKVPTSVSHLKNLLDNIIKGHLSKFLHLILYHKQQKSLLVLRIFQIKLTIVKTALWHMVGIFSTYFCSIVKHRLNVCRSPPKAAQLKFNKGCDGGWRLRRLLRLVDTFVISSRRDTRPRARRIAGIIPILDLVIRLASFINLPLSCSMLSMLSHSI